MNTYPVVFAPRDPKGLPWIIPVQASSSASAMTGPLTTLALAYGIHVPPVGRRADFEALADRGLAERCIDGAQHGYRITTQGRIVISEWRLTAFADKKDRNRIDSM